METKKDKELIKQIKRSLEDIKHGRIKEWNFNSKSPKKLYLLLNFLLSMTWNLYENFLRKV